MPPLIELRNVYKAFGTQKVLAGVNLSIEAGKITVIMGPSGTGKSVMLKHMIGLIQPDQGEIIVEGENVVGMDSKEINQVRRKFGMLFQDAALFDDMNVFENVSFPLYEHTDKKDDEILQEVEERLAEVGLENISHKLPNELSGGMRKRVGLARALMLNPKILLFDEPTTGLDPIITDQIAELIENTQKRHNVTAVVISHDVDLSYRLADRIAMLYQGKIIESESPEQFRRSRHPFVRQFLDVQLAANTRT